MATIGNLVVKLTADVTNFERNMGSAAKVMKNTEKEFNQVARRMESVGRALMVGVTLPLLLLGATAGRAAIQWEDAFAGVRKTVDATEQQYAELAQGLRRMATDDIPQTAEALAGIAENAGQLGIQRTAILGFTETMAQLGDTTNLAGEEAAKSLARFDNIMQSGQQSFDRMGSTIVALGNNLATTESEIMDMSMRLAGAGRVVKLTESQVFGLGGALSSVGLEAEAGGTAMSKTMIDIANAVATGGKQLDLIARVAGLSAEQFRAAWQQDAAGALVSFIEGLGRVNQAGGNLFGVLDALGMSEVRMRDALLRASGAGDLLRRSLNLASQAWEDNTALTDEAAKRYGTLASSLKFARNKAHDMAISLGEGLAPFMRAAMEVIDPWLDRLRRLAEGFSQLDPRIRGLIVGLVLTLALVGPAIYMFGLLAKTIGAVMGASAMMSAFAGRAAFAFLAWRGGASTLGEALSFLVGGKAKLIMIGIMGFAVAAIYVAAHWKQFAGIAVKVWNVVSAAVLYAASLVVRGVGMIISAMGLLFPSMRPAAQSVIGYADSLKSAATNALSMAKATSTMQSAAEAAQQTADAGNNAANSQENLAGAMDDAAKAAGANLQSFDQVHQIQDQSAGAVPDIPALDIPALDMGGIGGMGDMLGGLGDQVAEVGTKLAEGWNTAVSSISTAWDKLKAKAFETFPWLQTVVDGANAGIQWIRDNWPTIGPIIENIASVLMLSMVPALIKTGVEAVIAGGKMVTQWTLSGLAAVASVGKQVAQFVILGAKWLWMGVEATIHGAKIVAAWVAQGWEAAASVAKQVAEFVVLGAKWVWAGIQATIEGAKIVAAWVAQKAEAIASVAIQLGQFALLAGEWIAMGVRATIEGAKVVAAWIAQKAEAVASIGVQLAQFALLIGQWVVMGITSLATAAQMAAAWLIAFWPIALIVAAVVALAVLIYFYWDEIKAWTISAWEAIVGWLSTAWAWISSTAVSVWTAVRDFFVNLWTGIKTFFIDLWTSVRDWFINMVVAWAEWNAAVWNGVAGFFSTLWTGIVDFFVNIWTSVRDWFIGLITAWAEMNAQVWNGVAEFFSNTWTWIKDLAVGIWTGIVDFISGLVTGMTNAIVGAWNWVADKLSGIWEGIKSAASAAWNGLVSIIKTPINWIIGAINKFLDVLGSIRITIPEVDIPLVGKVGGWSIGLPQLPHIPMLADGGDIIGAGAAVVGEAGPELLNLPRGARVTPLSGGDGRIADEIAQAVYTAIRDAMRTSGASTSGSDRELVLQIDRQTFARLILPALRQEERRTGSMPIRLQGG